MKACPTCDLVYHYELLQFCRFDGTRLVELYCGEDTTQLLPPPMPHQPTRARIDSRTGELQNRVQ